jgi:hypothetical protein
LHKFPWQGSHMALSALTGLCLNSSFLLYVFIIAFP